MTFIGALPNAARSNSGSKKYPMGLLAGHWCSWARIAADGDPAMNPGLNPIAVPVMEISTVVPFDISSNSRRREIS
jgi:hypothetical protein